MSQRYVKWGKMRAFGSVADRTVPTGIGTECSEDCDHGARDQDGDPAGMALPAGREHLRGVQILIIDDCVLYRDSLAAALEANGTPATGSAWDVVTLLTALQTVSGGLILLNIATRDSAALLRTAMATDPGARVIVLGVSDDDDEGVIQCAEAGAAGYHTRTESFEDLLEVMTNVDAGEPSCSGGWWRSCSAGWRRSARNGNPKCTNWFSPRVKCRFSEC